MTRNLSVIPPSTEELLSQSVEVYSLHEKSSV